MVECLAPDLMLSRVANKKLYIKKFFNNVKKTAIRVMFATF